MNPYILIFNKVLDKLKMMSLNHNHVTVERDYLILVKEIGIYGV